MRVANWIVLMSLIPWVAFAQPSRVLKVTLPAGAAPDEVCLVK